MKLRIISLASLMVVFASNLGALPLTSNNFDFFLQPLRMTSSGVESFFSTMYNANNYAQDFLPNNFSHLTQFLEHGKQNGQNRDYTKATLSLFNQKLHGCQYVSAYAFNDFLAELPQLVGHHFTRETKARDDKKQAVTNLLYQEFLHHFNEFKENPPAFFDKLSTNIVATLDPHNPAEISAEYLQQTLVRFIETGLSKLLWDVNDPYIWDTVKQISQNVEQLSHSGIIREADDLNDLAWALTHRLCYFIDLTGAELPAAFYEAAHQQIRQDAPPLLALEEQEELAQTKLAVIERAVVEGMARQQAREHGLVA